MKITAKAEVINELYDKYGSAIMSDLRTNVCKELLRHSVFIEPPCHNDNGKVSVEMHFFALSYGDINALKRLSSKYPELNKILQDIIVKV